MIEKCSNCSNTYDSNRTEPQKAGYGEEVNALFSQLCKTSDLYDNCLIERIYKIREKMTAPQD